MKPILVISTVLVSCVLAEAVYRLWLHRDLEHNSYNQMRYNFSSTERPLYVLDRETGYSYRSNARLHFRLYDRENNFVRENQLITNNFGHLSPEDDEITKPQWEYRIAILGDSFTATTTSDITWPTDLQRDLNNDPAAKRVTGKRTFKVMNFGLDGTGLVQWPSVYKYKAKAFNPDLVIVSFIGNDIHREFIFRQTIRLASGNQVMITCSSLPAEIYNNDCLNAYSFVMDPDISGYRTRAARIKKELYETMVARLPWLSPHSELLAAVLNGRFGSHRRLQFRGGSMFYFKSSEAALAASESALRTIAREQHALMVLYHPTFQECLTKQLPPEVKELIRRESDIKLTNMLDFLPAADQDEIKKWYNLPYDWHPSNYGAEVYARAVESRVLDYLSSSKMTTFKASTADPKN